ncbi:MAG: lysine--tRNA ligase [Coxiella sp. RIFCSPHIGHO2_12_FULL_42_15]|nr:MAG: lysine--tRNA ligase [Coxiella sp. RIFCSPHIGHO2_12_FULL_42_15]
MVRRKIVSESIELTTDDTIEFNENEQIAQRKLKLMEWRQKGQAYPNQFQRDELALDLRVTYDKYDSASLTMQAVHVRIAGRMMTRRIMGKASFAHLQDMSGRIQVYIARDQLPEEQYEEFKGWDLGDILGVEGEVFKTKTGELSIKAHRIHLLTKALRPLPDKFHGLSDTEQCYRQRYVDLMVNEKTRHVFKMRVALVTAIRRFFDERGFMEVETPMMHAMAGGAAARPFLTHHNTLDMDLFLRIAPELYLKRLVVGGFEKVYEINRNFRNEGISTRHNPEFTMLEFYWAYATYIDLMNLTEILFRYLAKNLLKTEQLTAQGESIDFSKPFTRISLRNSILHFNPDIAAAELDDLKLARHLAERLGINVNESHGLGKIQTELFEKLVEKKLVQPTFITEFPREVSPLARANDNNPFITDRFEFFVMGQEVANGFSELNDPEDQAERFRQQMQAKASGDEEAMDYDDDYITALEYGLPPTAGEGIGIDRLAMLFTDSASIRDVILFPLMRPKDD